MAAKLPETEPEYTKGEVLPIRWKPISDSVNCGPIGAMAYCWARRDPSDPTHDSRMLLLREIYENSPAEGKLEPGDVVVGVISPKIPPYRPYAWIPLSEQAPAKNDYVDATKFPYDVRNALAASITEAEKKENGGKLVLNVWRDGKTIPVALQLPVMGSYSRTTPFDCEKTDLLISKTADQIVERGIGTYIQGSIDALGLLATGEEKYLKALHDWVRENKDFNPNDTEIRRSGDAWGISYQLIFTAEYYMATKDEYVLPALNRMAMVIALGQSHAGTWSHEMASPGYNYGRDHGMTASYGSMNTVTGACSVALVLAKKAGVDNENVDKAIEKSLNFLAYFSERGTVPYGDHTPWMKHNENNGKNSQAAVLFDLAGRPKEARYFSRMALASHRSREQGHTGHYWSFIWGQIGAARSGDEATQASTSNLNWFHELERRPDNDYVVQPQLRYGHWKTPYWKTAGMRLWALCIPRKEIYLTGKGGNSFEPVVGEELIKTLEAGGAWPSADDSVDELLASLVSFSPCVREYAAEALGTKSHDLVNPLVEMLLHSKDPDTRRGAAMGLCYAGRGSQKAVDALISTLEKTDDQVLKHFVVRALHAPNSGNGLATSDAISKAIPVLFKLATIKDPADPWSKLHSEISCTLFDGANALAYDYRKKKAKNLEDIPQDLLVAALQSWLSNVNGYTRGWASLIFESLDDDTLEPLWRDIYLASLIPSTSGVMGHQAVMTNGVKLMAKKNIKEGLILGAIQCRRPGWGEIRRVSEIAEILPMYGAAAEPYFKEYVPWMENRMSSESDQAGKGNSKVAEVKNILSASETSLESKELQSISTYLKKEDIELAIKMFEFYPVKTEAWNKNKGKWDAYNNK